MEIVIPVIGEYIVVYRHVNSNYNGLFGRIIGVKNGKIQMEILPTAEEIEWIGSVTSKVISVLPGDYIDAPSRLNELMDELERISDCEEFSEDEGNSDISLLSVERFRQYLQDFTLHMHEIISMLSIYMDGNACFDEVPKADEFLICAKMLLERPQSEILVIQLLLHNINELTPDKDSSGNCNLILSQSLLLLSSCLQMKHQLGFEHGAKAANYAANNINLI